MLLLHPVADPGEGPPPPALFFDQTETWRETRSPPPSPLIKYQRVWMTSPSLSQSLDPALSLVALVLRYVSLLCMIYRIYSRKGCYDSLKIWKHFWNTYHSFKKRHYWLPLHFNRNGLIRMMIYQNNVIYFLFNCSVTNYFIEFYCPLHAIKSAMQILCSWWK